MDRSRQSRHARQDAGSRTLEAERRRRSAGARAGAVLLSIAPLAAAVVSVLLLAGGCGPSPPEPSAAPEAGAAATAEQTPGQGEAAAFKNQQEDRALREEQIAAARELLAAFPTNDDALYLVGLIQNEQGDAAAALQSWEKALELDPRRADVCSSLGYAAFLAEDYERALAFYRRALEISPGLPEASLRIAQILEKQGHMAEAAGLLEKARLRDPLAYRLQGQVYQQLGKNEEARKAYEAALALNPEFAEACYGLATIWARLGDGAKSREYRQKFDALKSTGQVTGRRQRTEFDPLAITKMSTAHSHTDVGRVWQAQGRADLAEKLWLRAASLDAANVDCRLHLATLYQTTGREAEALRLYDEVARIDPRSAVCHMNAGAIHLRSRRLDEAKKAFGKAAELAPDRPECRAALARVTLLQGTAPREAVSHAEAAVRLAPGAPAWALLAQALAASGERGRAVQAMEQAVKLDPGNREYASLLEKLREAK